MSVLERVRAHGPVPRDLETEELAEQRRRLKRDLVEQLGEPLYIAQHISPPE